MIHESTVLFPIISYPWRPCKPQGVVHPLTHRSYTRTSPGEPVLLLKQEWFFTSSIRFCYGRQKCFVVRWKDRPERKPAFVRSGDERQNRMEMQNGVYVGTYIETYISTYIETPREKGWGVSLRCYELIDINVVNLLIARSCRLRNH